MEDALGDRSSKEPDMNVYRWALETEQQHKWLKKETAC